MKSLKIISIIMLCLFCGCQATQITQSNESSLLITSTNAATVEASATPSPTPLSSRYNEYSIVLDVDPENLSVKGVERIKYINTADVPMTTIYINTYLNAFSEDCDYRPYFDSFKQKIFREGISYGQINVIGVSVNNNDTKFSHNNTVLSFEPEVPVANNETIDIAISFEASIPKINHRTGANDQAMWFGNFIPTLAVYDKNGWQIDKYYAAGDPFYSRIANYHVVVNTPSNYTVAGTGLKSSVTVENKKSTTFDAKLVRDFAFALSNNYSEASLVTDNGIEITMYYYSDIENVREYLQTAANSLEYFGKTVGSYPYADLDIIECGLFFNAGMEYPGVIFMDSDYLHQSAAMTSLTHEVGHQWFYNVIGNNQITGAWIDEGMTLLVQEGFFNDEESIDRKIRAEYDNLAVRLLSIKNTSLTQNPDEFKSWSDYYNVVYLKSKMMLYSLKLKMGPKFSEFLTKYYIKYSFKTVNTKIFIEMAEEIYEDDLSSFFDAWLGNNVMPELEVYK